jgi:hypothetical protein
MEVIDLDIRLEIDRRYPILQIRGSGSLGLRISAASSGKVERRILTATPTFQAAQHHSGRRADSPGKIATV